MKAIKGLIAMPFVIIGYLLFLAIGVPIKGLVVGWIIGRNDDDWMILGIERPTEVSE